MAYTAGFSVSVGDPTKASDVTTLAANDDYLKAAVDAKAVLTGDVNNTVATVTGANALVGEADLTFATPKLTVFGPDGSSAAGSAGVLNLSTRETGVVDADQLGRIEFQAPAETGSDAVLVAASIYAEADGTFSATVNATDLVLATAHDGAAAERVRITSQGEIGLAGANYGTDGQVMTSAGAGAAVAWEAIPAGLTFNGDTANGVVTFGNSTTADVESSLTFDGSVLAVTGALTMANAAGPTIVNEAATATNPTLIPNKAEVDTGYGWAAADTLTVITGGTERMRIDSTGQVGIGTSDPEGTLDIYKSVAGLSAHSHLKLTNENETDGDYTGILFDARTVADGGKGWFGFERQSDFGVGDFVFLLDNVGDDNVVAASDEVMRITRAGMVGIDEAANGFMTQGLTINQEANDNEILAFKSSDVAHGVTDYTETDTYGFMKKRHGSYGGLYIAAVMDPGETSPLVFNSTGSNPDDTRSTAGKGMAHFDLYKTNGTGRTSLGGTENLVTFADANTTRFIFAADGTGYADVAWTTYSDARLKKNIEIVPYGLDEVLKLEPKVFDKHSGSFSEAGEVVLEDNGKRQIGFLAQDVKALMPELVDEVDDSKSFYSLSDGKLAAVLVRAIQELNDKLEAN